MQATSCDILISICLPCHGVGHMFVSVPSLLAFCSTKLQHAKVVQSNGLKLGPEPDFLLLPLGLQVHLLRVPRADVV